MKGAILYLSSNREKPEFEYKIIEDMLNKKGDLPITSVTQQPMYLGKNICIGDVGTSGFNFCRQMQIGLQDIKADYVIAVEADCLYSPDYFKFVPPNINAIYRNTNNYVIPYKKNHYLTKNSQTAFQVAGRTYLLSRLDYLLTDQPKWNIDMKNFPKEIDEQFLESWETFKTEFGCITIKTGDGMRRHTSSGNDPIYKLPYWGTAKELRQEYL